jgi:hypothetical protein
MTATFPERSNSESVNEKSSPEKQTRESEQNRQKFCDRKVTPPANVSIPHDRPNVITALPEVYSTFAGISSAGEAASA